MRTAGLWLLWIGAVILVVSIVAGIIMTVFGIGKNKDVLGDSVPPFTSNATVTVDKGQRFSVLTRMPGQPRSAGSSPGSSPSHGTPPVAKCTVTDAAGKQLTKRGSVSSWRTRNGQSFGATGYYEAQSSGTVSVRCADGKQHVVATPVDMGGLFGAVGGVVIGVFGATLGIFAILLGLLFFFLGRSSIRRYREGWHRNW